MLIGLGADKYFEDVPVDSPIYAATVWLAEKGISNGCGSGRYCPDDPVTRGQLALFLHRMAEAPLSSGSSKGWTGGGSDGVMEFFKRKEVLLGAAALLLVLLMRK